jgi:hypothetical protein
LENDVFGTWGDVMVDDVIGKYKQFQTDFWHQQHHWYTAYRSMVNRADIFTVPYINNEYELTPYENLYCNTPIPDSKLFDNVTKLTVWTPVIIKNSHPRFSNVTSLILERKKNFRDELDCAFTETNTIESLKTIINLSILKHLDTRENCFVAWPSILLQTLKETPRLSTLSIYESNLRLLLDHDELCKYFNKMITKLLLLSAYISPCNPFYQFERVWEIFSNLEQLRCNISRQDDLLVLFSRLPRLLNLTVRIEDSVDQNINLWLQENVP